METGVSSSDFSFASRHMPLGTLAICKLSSLCSGSFKELFRGGDLEGIIIPNCQRDISLGTLFLVLAIESGNRKRLFEDVNLVPCAVFLGSTEFGVNVVQIPLEAFALKIVTGWEKKFLIKHIKMNKYNC